MVRLKDLRFRKTALTLYIIAMLALFAILVRSLLGERIVTSSMIDFSVFPLPIIIIAAAYFLCTVALWLPLRKKGIRFVDLFYPISTLSGITILIYFHFTWFA